MSVGELVALGELEVALRVETLLVLVRLGRGAAYHIAAGVLELVGEFLHLLIELFHLRGNQPSRISPVDEERLYSLWRL